MITITTKNVALTGGAKEKEEIRDNDGDNEVYNVKNGNVLQKIRATITRKKIKIKNLSLFSLSSSLYDKKIIDTSKNNNSNEGENTRK